MLLLLDNFEQVLPAAPLVWELLAAAPQLKALVTSRAVLRLSGEHEMAVPPLAVPALRDSPSSSGARSPERLGAPDAPDPLGEYPAVRLFVVRVQEHKTFKREGNHLVAPMPVSFAQAALGAEIEVPTLDGKETVNLPRGTQGEPWAWPC